jgi:hypothetical protein
MVREVPAAPLRTSIGEPAVLLPTVTAVVPVTLVALTLPAPTLAAVKPPGTHRSPASVRVRMPAEKALLMIWN